MRASTRWTLAALIVLIALVVALWREIGGDDDTVDSSPGTSVPGAAREHRDADTAEALAGPRARADLPPCPAPSAGGADPGSLRDVVVECAGDGARVDVGQVLGGRAVVLNLWAYWCGPCADELPAMAEYQRRVGPAVTVLTVHQDENEAAGLSRLAELGVRLPTLQDGRRLIAAALAVPNVMPATVVLRSDGTVAEILPRAFTSADEIAAAVNSKIGEPG